MLDAQTDPVNAPRPGRHFFVTGACQCKSMKTLTFPSADKGTERPASPIGLGRHKTEMYEGLAVVACENCRELSFSDSQGPVAGRVGLARLFGDFDLVSALGALGAPAKEVLAYRPPNARARKIFRLISETVWLQGADGLWLAHDGEFLLIAHGSPWLTRHLLDGA